MTASGIEDDLGFAGVRMGEGACGVESGAHSGIGCAEHRAAEFDAAEAGIGEVLCGRRTFLEPAIVGDVHDHLRAGTQKQPGDTCQGVLEADGGDGSDACAGKGGNG